jgi:lysophospholipase L1-like esterase
MEFLRFSPGVLAMSNTEAGFNTVKARTTSCASLDFSTDSSNVQLNFIFNAGDELRNGDFIVNQNSEYYATFHFTGTATDAVLDLQSNDPGKMVDYSVVLPTFANPILTGIVIDDGSVITEVVTPSKKVYVAFGDSITHGVGQDDSTQTYAYRLAEKFELELFNLAVGGGKISVPAAESLVDWNEVDLITILIGYNDLHFAQKTVEEYNDKYNEMLDAIRVNHPDSPLFCITLLYTTNIADDVTGITAEEFRVVVENIVAERQAGGDQNIFLVIGDEITSAANLRDGDMVHLDIEGAAMFADELYKEINRACPTCVYPMNMKGFALMASSWLTSGTDLEGDLDVDGSVDMFDLVIMGSCWLSDCYE